MFSQLIYNLNFTTTTFFVIQPKNTISNRWKILGNDTKKVNLS